MKTEPGTEKLAKRFIRMFKCDTARITKPCDRWFLIIGWNRNTKDDKGRWVRNGEPIDFDYVHEEVIANGANEEELIASAKHYKKLSGMTWEQIFKKGLRWAFPTLCLLLCSCNTYHDMYGNAYTATGGDGDVTFPGGGHMTYTNTASFQHLMQAATTVATTGFTAWGAQAAKSSDNAAATAQQANTLNAQTTQAANAANAATAQAQISANAAKVAGQQANAIQLSTILKKGPPTPK